MGSSNNRLSLEKVKQIDLVNYLAGLGFQPDPKKSKGNDYWYNSPLHNENTASFHVNRRLNRWYDHGGVPGRVKGGNIIDFAIQFHECTVSEFLSKIRSGKSFNSVRVQGEILPAEKEGKIKITDSFPLKSYPLLNYAMGRGIPLEITKAFCCEVRYESKGKSYYGIGFKNDLGGYEIRNAFVKSGNMPKGITTIDNGSDKVMVFEGFFDFLSYLTIHQNKPESKYNFVILNSTAFFEKARPFMEKHQQIGLFLDHGKGGRLYTDFALSLCSKYRDESTLYKGFDDLNDFHVKSSKEIRPRKAQRLR